MLPPPTTTEICTPRCWTRRTWSAIRAIRSGSAPYSSGPIRASPESFRRTRSKAGGALSCAPTSSRAISRRARDAGPHRQAAVKARRRPSSLGAHLEAGEAADHDVLAGLGGGRGAELLDRLPAVLVGIHVRLVEQHVLLEPLAPAALDDLRARLLGLVLSLLLEDPLLGLAQLGRDLVLGHVLRRRGGDVQRDVTRELLEVGVLRDEVGLAVDLHEHADLARRVDVALDRALR